MKIAVDAMGGDYAPKVIIEGVEQARDEYSDLEFILFGKQDAIKEYLTNNTRIEIVHTDEKIQSDEDPVRAVKRKPNASMILAAQAVKDNKADALFSMGSTGALLAAGLFIIGRIKGIERPGLMPTFPAVKNVDEFVMLDVGANAENRPNQLYQFGLMGTVYSRDVLKIKNPRVALLNNGTEPNKGDDLHKAAYKILEDSDLNFVGNVEANTLLQGVADVVVTDGFTGNATLKAMEGTMRTVFSLLKHTILDGGVKTKLGGLMLKSDLGKMRDKFDTDKYGNATLIGLNAPIVKSHGAANAKAVFYAMTDIRAMLMNQTIKQVIDYFENHPVKD